MVSMEGNNLAVFLHLIAFLQGVNSATFLFAVLNSTQSINMKTFTSNNDVTNIKLNGNPHTSSSMPTDLLARAFYVEASGSSSLEAAIVYGTSGDMGEAMSLIPFENLDKEYRAVTYCEVFGYCQIAVASEKDNTKVKIELPHWAKLAEIYPSDNIKRQNQMVEVTLAKYEALYIDCNACDLTGTHIVSENNKIAVVSGSRNAIVGYGNQENILMEHLPPVSKWGLEFAWTCYDCGDQGSYIRIVASQGGTKVSVLGYKTVLLTSPFKWLQCRIEQSDAVIITADKPVMVAAFILNRKVDGDFHLSSMIIIPPTHHFENHPLGPNIKLIQKGLTGSKSKLTQIRHSSLLPPASLLPELKSFPSRNLYAFTGFNAVNEDAGMYFVQKKGFISYGFALSTYKNDQQPTSGNTIKIEGDEKSTDFVIAIPNFSFDVSVTITFQGNNTIVPTIFTNCKFEIETYGTSSWALNITDMSSCASQASGKSVLINNALICSTNTEVTALVTITGDDKAAAFLALPSDVLGFEYYVITYCASECTCAISAKTSDASGKAKVEISLPDLKSNILIYNNTYYASYGSFSVAIDELQTFVLTYNADLTGTYIKGNVKLAVVCGGQTATGLFLEQIPPIQTLGTGYILPMKIHNGKVKILATESNTIVTVAKRLNVFHRHILIEAGHFVEDSSSSFMSVNATKPILVMFIQDDSIVDGFMMNAVSSTELVKEHAFSVPSLNNKMVQFRSEKLQEIKITEKGMDFNFESALNINDKLYSIHTMNNSYKAMDISAVSNEGFATFFYGIGNERDKRSVGTAIGREMKTVVKEICRITDMVINDTKDNDCDGLIDEDICITKVEVYENITGADKYIYDFDIDGLISEDCGMEVPEPRRCKCPCNVLGDPSIANMSSQQLASVMAATKKQLTKNKTSLSSFIRKRISVKDDRPSSVGFGVLGAFMIGVVVVALTIADFISFGKYLLHKCK